MMAYVSVIIPILGILLAFVRLRLFSNVRTFMIFLSLGCGQIHLSTIALLIYLFVENGLRILPNFNKKTFFILVTIYIGIVSQTLMTTLDAKVISEILQLLAYLIIFMHFQLYLNNINSLSNFLQCGAFAALSVAVIGIILYFFDYTTVPHIFLGRGGNEGSTYLLFIGVLSNGFLFLTNRNPIYLIFILICLSAQDLATSRANIVLSLVSLIATFFFIFERKWKRVIILILGILIILFIIPTILELWVGNVNTSVTERIALYITAYEIWSVNPVIGSGWGSTTRVLSEYRFAENTYPHFHSTFAQLIVELGYTGLAIILVWLVFLFYCIKFGVLYTVSPAVRYYVCVATFVVFLSGLSEALIYGGDRALGFIIVYGVVFHLLRKHAGVKVVNVGSD